MEQINAEYAILPLSRLSKLESDIEEIKGLFSKNSLQNDPDELLSLSQVRQLLKISVKTEWNWRKKTLIPYTQISGKIYYRRGDVMQFVKDNQLKSRKS